jgi:hypothetical protein
MKAEMIEFGCRVRHYSVMRYFFRTAVSPRAVPYSELINILLVLPCYYACHFRRVSMHLRLESDHINSKARDLSQHTRFECRQWLTEHSPCFVAGVPLITSIKLWNRAPFRLIERINGHLIDPFPRRITDRSSIPRHHALSKDRFSCTH